MKTSICVTVDENPIKLIRAHNNKHPVDKVNISELCNEVLNKKAGEIND